LFQAVQQPRDVRIACDHAISNLAAGQPFGRTSQYAQNVVLRGREILRLQQLYQRPAQHFRGPGQIQESNLFRNGSVARFSLRCGRSLHLPTSIIVSTTIVNTAICAEALQPSAGNPNVETLEGSWKFATPSQVLLES